MKSLEFDHNFVKTHTSVSCQVLLKEIYEHKCYESKQLKSVFLKEVVINVFVLHVKKHDKASHKATTTAILVVGLKSFVQICSKFIYKYSSAKNQR